MKNFSKKLSIIMFAATLLAGGLFFAFQITHAQPVDVGLQQVSSTIGLPSTDIRLIVARIIRTALGLLGILALVLVLYGGFIWMTAGGNEEKIAQAKKILTNAAIGLVIILSAYAITSFVINSLAGATSNYPTHCSNGALDPGVETGIDCGIECPTCLGNTDPYILPNLFYIDSLPSGGVLCIRNAHPAITFNIPVDVTTVQNNIVINDSVGAAQSGAWSVVNGNTVMFTPQGDCGDGGVPDCLSAKTNYVVHFNNASAIKSTNALTLNCNIKAGCKDVSFTTGEGIGRNAPTVKFKPVPSDALQAGSVVPITATFTAESGIQKLDLRADTYFVESKSFSGCVKNGEVTFNWPTQGLLSGSHSLQTTVYDQVMLQASDNMIVNLKPSHCFNDALDDDEEEVGPPACGGECGKCGGKDCTNSSDCSSGFCENGKCVNKMYITSVSPLSGAPGTFVTINGVFFGDKTGKVFFGNTEATLAPCGSSGGWRPWQVVVQVPVISQGSMPIKVQTTATDTTGAYISDATDDLLGPNLGRFTVNTLTRPGICAITPGSGLPGSEISLSGKNFGTGRNGTVSFGDLSALIDPSKVWSDAFISGVAVPTALAESTVGVKMTLNGVYSNSVRFFVISGISNTSPIISYITPDTGAKGEYVTITGRNFGNSKGMVLFKLNKNDSDSAGIQGDFDHFPAECKKQLWRDDQIIVMFPKDAGHINSKYFVQVKPADINKGGSPIGPTFDLKSGSPNPGICALDPASGPAPLPEGGTMKIAGNYFGDSSATSSVYFWSANASDINNLTNRPQAPTGTDHTFILSNTSDGNGDLLTVEVPAEAKSGPIIISRPTDNSISNPEAFTVLDCVKNNNTCTVPNTHCCVSGGEAGTCKTGLCEGETLSAGYIWMFSTKEIPPVPHVVERCDNGSDLGTNLPSPSPSAQWDDNANGDHHNVCRSAVVVVDFSVGNINPISRADIIVNECKPGDAGQVNQQTRTCVPLATVGMAGTGNITLQNSTQNSSFFKLYPTSTYNGGKWKDNTWYQVVLKDGITAGTGATLAHLSKDKPCDVDGGVANSAYCFVFKTDAQDCKMKGVIVTPYSYWTSVLEAPIKYRSGASDSGSDLFYQAHGLSDQHCIMMDTQGANWKWGTSSSTKASIYSVVLGHSDMSQVSALANTVGIGMPNDSVNITATATMQFDISNNGLVLWWTFDSADMSGTSVLDKSGNGNNGTKSGSPYIVDGGVINQAMHFTSSTSNVYDFYQAAKTPNASTSVSISIWYKVDSLDTGLPITYRAILSSGIFRFLTLNTAGQRTPTINFYASNVYLQLGSGVKSIPGKWTHIVATHDGQQAKIYVNGILRNTATSVGTTTWPSIKIGHYPIDNGANDFTGDLDDFRIYNRALSASEVSNLYNQTALTYAGQSPLTIDLSNPQVVDFWPKCNESCTNAAVGVRFNTTMSNRNLPGDQSGPVKLYQCTDENCFNTITVPTNASLSAADDYTKLDFGLAANALSPNSLYKAVLSVSSSVLSNPALLWSAATYNHPETFAKPFKQEFSWRFKTKKDACQVVKVDVQPSEFIAKNINDRQVYIAQPFGSPDTCDAKGQKLNPWTINWSWGSSDPLVASVQSFATKGHNPFCTANCLRKGSDIPFGVNTIFPICGNNKIEAGEDCDAPSSTLGCGLDCRRMGNTNTTTCNNGVVEPRLGEQCDLADPNTKIGCSDKCLHSGSNSSPSAISASASICGNGLIGSGEDCDLDIAPSISNSLSAEGCSANCLHLGTRLSNKWCLDHQSNYGGFSQSNFEAACKMALSQCGDGIDNPDEDTGCDQKVASGSGNDCDNFCLLRNRDNGSSLLYATPSVCGDGVVGTGEDTFCEENLSNSHSNLTDPWGLAIGVANGTASGDPLAQRTNITATTGAVSGSGKFTIPCGYSTDQECQARMGAGYGVAKNSCCMRKPQLISFKPAATDDVCPNTVIQAEYDAKIDPNTILNNVIVANQTDGACASGSADVSGFITSQLAPSVLPIIIRPALDVIIQAIHFVRGLFIGDTAKAAWCAGDVLGVPEILQGSSLNTSIISYKLLKPLAVNTNYSVILTKGIKDFNGVSINTTTRQFTTGPKICEVASAAVRPANVYFGAAGQTTTLFAQAFTADTSEIQPIAGVYNWEYLWGPRNDYITFTDTKSSQNLITAQNRNGEIDARVSVNITENKYSSQSGIAATGKSHVIVFLCENPWPPKNPNIIIPYEDRGGRSIDVSSIKKIATVQVPDGSPYTTIGPVYANGSYIYIGQGNNMGRGIVRVYDVYNPSAPSLVSSITLGGLGVGSIQDMQFQGSIAYVTIGNGAWNASGKLFIIDFSNPALPVIKGSVDINNGGKIAITAQRAYVLGIDNMYGGSGSVKVVDISDINHPVLLSAQDVSIAGSNPSNIFIEDMYAYVPVAGNYGNEGSVSILNISESTTMGPRIATSIGGAGKDISFFKPVDVSAVYPYLYVLNNWAASFSIINVSNVTRPQEVSSFAVGSYPNSIYVSGNYAYVTNYSSGDVSIVDISNPISPKIITTVPVGNRPTSVYAYGRYAYVTHGTDNFSVIDLSGILGSNNDGYDLTKTGPAGFDGQSSIPAAATGGYFNFSTYYCADNGKTGTADDLPYLRPAVQTTVDGTSLKRFLFTNEKNSDAIGIKVFSNNNHYTVRQWFEAEKSAGGQGFIGDMKDVKIDGYDAVSDGNNIYVDGLNYNNSNLYTNIYLFSVNANAAPETKKVFEQLVGNLKFNINLTNYRYCGDSMDNPGVSTTCSTDLECTAPQICSAQKDKLQRNYQRLRGLNQLQQAIEQQ